MNNELLDILKSFKKEKDVASLIKKTMHKGNSNFREIFDIDSDEFQKFPVKFRMEILKYLLTFYNKENENDMIGMWLPVLISEWEKASGKELPINRKFSFAFHVAEYLLWE